MVHSGAADQCVSSVVAVGKAVTRRPPSRVEQRERRRKESLLRFGDRVPRGAAEFTEELEGVQPELPRSGCPPRDKIIGETAFLDECAFSPPVILSC